MLCCESVVRGKSLKDSCIVPCICLQRRVSTVPLHDQSDLWPCLLPVNLHFLKEGCERKCLEVFCKGTSLCSLRRVPGVSLHDELYLWPCLLPVDLTVCYLVACEAQTQQCRHSAGSVVEHMLCIWKIPGLGPGFSS